MATAFEGEAIVAIVRASGSGGTIYTVPSGRYAKLDIQILSVMNTGSFTIGGNAVTNTSGSTENYGKLDEVLTTSAGGQIGQEIFLLSGETVVVSSATISLIAREFANP